VLAAAEYADASGRELLTALAVAYQVQCRLTDEAPVRASGFDHTTQGVGHRPWACRSAELSNRLPLHAAQTPLWRIA
jgi:2-methylcitrate dehydratase